LKPSADLTVLRMVSLKRESAGAEKIRLLDIVAL